MVQPDHPARARRLAVFLPSLEAGGAEGVMTTIMNGMVERGISVELLLASQSGPNMARLDPRVVVTDMRAKSVLRALPALVHHLRDGRHDTLLSAMSHANIVACAAAMTRSRRALRLVISERMSLEARDRFYTSTSERFVRAAMPWLYRRADAVVIPAQDMISALLRHTNLPDERFHVIPNPLAAGSVENRLRAPWPLGDRLIAKGRRIILAVGRLTAVKDYPTLLRAFARLDPGLATDLIILGEGEERSGLESLVAQFKLQDRVFLPGHIDDPLPAMARADVFVLSSLFEGLPNVLLQALLAGAPVVSTDCPTGPREILEDGRHGLLVPVGDPAMLAAAISETLTSRPAFSGFDASRYSLDTIIGQYLSVLYPA